jgi:hypothetical protein
MTILPPDGHTYCRSYLFCVYQTHYSKNQKSLSVGRISHNPPSKCGLNDNATISKIPIAYGRYSYYLNYSHDHIT